MKLLMESWRKYINEIYISRDCKKKTGETGHCAVLSPSTKKQISCYDNCGTAKMAHSGEINEEQSISYSGVVLDEESRQKLLELSIPDGWEPVAHHMTIAMGPLVHKKGKHDFSKTYPVGEEIELPVISVGLDERAMAVKVGVPNEISKKISFPHVTVAVNREGGGKPFHSNKIPEENFEPLEDTITLRGVVEEVPQ